MLLTERKYFAMGARLYDPEIGRFLSVDPLCDKFPEQNAYNYCFNNPLTMKDPSGLEPEDENSWTSFFENSTKDYINSLWVLSHELCHMYDAYNCGGFFRTQNPDIDRETSAQRFAIYIWEYFNSNRKVIRY